MKILQFSYSLSSGGAERFVVDLCNSLSECSETEVILVSILDDNIPGRKHYLPELTRSVEYVCLNVNRVATFKAFWRVLQVIMKRKPDVVHAHIDLPLLFLPALLFFKKIKFIQTLHSIAQKNISYMFLRCLYKLFYRYFIRPVTISRVCDKSYLEFYGLRNSLCVYNGRTPIKATACLEDVKAEIIKYCPVANCPVFVHVARYGEAKNQQMLIDVFERLARAGEKFVLLIVGHGHENAPYYKRIQSPQIKILGVKNNVADYLSCADFFVLSSLWEGLPISLLEAMSVGCVPVCTPAGGVSDVINNGKNGFLSESCDEEDFYQMINSVLHRGHFDDIKAQIYSDFHKTYTMSRCVEQYMNIYISTTFDNAL